MYLGSNKMNNNNRETDGITDAKQTFPVAEQMKKAGSVESDMQKVANSPTASIDIGKYLGFCTDMLAQAPELLKQLRALIQTRPAMRSILMAGGLGLAALVAVGTIYVGRMRV